eukprot:CAMPEP_0118881370 /NCGR_PEP_ID=MMETSP1163-20130328/20862_1 /TAXON_ID=124430 /ORGANISM="Phaeomonas parva, Strain CCMP2877" /LENGTH=115 /DNA_ID=CAMNT_0006818133 /DNA_START=143 /DNA_END=486 /DNA_ORIENTATION=+
MSAQRVCEVSAAAVTRDDVGAVEVYELTVLVLAQGDAAAVIELAQEGNALGLGFGVEGGAFLGVPEEPLVQRNVTPRRRRPHRRPAAPELLVAPGVEERALRDRRGARRGAVAQL